MAKAFYLTFIIDNMDPKKVYYCSCHEFKNVAFTTLTTCLLPLSYKQAGLSWATLEINSWSVDWLVGWLAGPSENNATLRPPYGALL